MKDWSAMLKEAQSKGGEEVGVKFDDEKPRTDLLPSHAILEVAKILTYGAHKYEAHNWRKGLPWSRVYAAVQRHLMAWNDGETNDKESGLNHLAHACCNLMFLIEYSKTHGDLDDRFLSNTDSNSG